jgi:PKD repeat protein
MCLSILAIAGEVSGQCSDLVTLNGTAGSFFGRSVAIIGDIDGDSIDDYIVGAPNDSNYIISNGSNLGRAFVYSGGDASGNPLRSLVGSFVYDPPVNYKNGLYGWSVAGVGDVNGDDVPDYAVGEPNYRGSGHEAYAAGRLFVYSGANGVSLNFPLIEQNGKYRVGTSVASAGDVNNDGSDDVIVGGPLDSRFQPGLEGHAWVYSYQWDENLQDSIWVELYEKQGPGYYQLFGDRVSGAGYVDDDEYADFMITSRIVMDYGGVIVYSGVDGSEIATLQGALTNQKLGRSIAPLADINGDNRDDIIVGDGLGAVHIYSIIDETVLSIYDHADSDFGISVSSVPDQDGDGLPDVLIGNPNFTRMHTFSSAGLTLIQNIIGSSTDFGFRVAGLGTSNDGYGMTVTGAPASNQAIVYNCGYTSVDFSGDPLAGSRPLEVNFTSEVSADVTAWSWDFGDQGTSSDTDPTHIYTTAGDFTVTLTVTGADGDVSEIKPNYITVNPVLPQAVFSATPQSGVRPLTVNFVEASLGDPTDWDWDFGDGGTSTEIEPVYVYEDPGVYTVSLTVTNPDGEDTETITDFINVTYRTVWVDDDGNDLTGDGSAGAPYATLQKGIDEALDGDTVMVKAGTYTGSGNRNVQFHSGYVYLISESGAENTIVDPEGADRAFKFPARDGMIKGFTIQNGDRTGHTDKDGGAIFINGRPIIEDCIIKNCSASHGAGIYVGMTVGGQAEIRNVLLYDNTATIAGGGVYVANATAVLDNCTYADNNAPNGAAVGIADLSGSATLNRNLLAFNSGDGVYCEGATANVTFDCCVFWEHVNGHVTGNCSFPTDPAEAVEADPQFCDRPEDDYGVYLGSPCDPGFSQCGELVGALPASCTELDDWTIEMGRLDAGYMGHVVTLPIYITEPQIPLDLDSMQFRIKWNPAAMTFLTVRPGDFLSDCGWDYSTYWIKSSPYSHVNFWTYPQTGGDPPSCRQPVGKQTLFEVDFLLSMQSYYAEEWLPVEFCWPDGVDDECETNTFGKFGEAGVLTADDVFTWYDYLIPAGTPNLTPLPECDGYGTEAIDFYNGYIYFVDMLGPAVRGDINLNSIRFEIGDAVLFTCAFIHLPEECFTIDYDLQMAATDINCDGLEMTVDDYNYLLGIIIGDLPPDCPGSPLGKILTSSDTLRMLSTIATQGQRNKPIEISLANQADIASLQAHIVYNPAVLDPIADTNCASDYCVKYELTGRAADYEALGQVLVKSVTPGELQIYFLADDDLTVSIPAGSGSILKVYFDIPSNAPIGEQTYQPVDDGWQINRLATADAQGISPELVLGTVFVRRSLPPPSCPVLFSYDGSGFTQHDPLLTACEQFGYQEVVTDYYQLQTTPAVTENGIRFQLRELEDEVTYLDGVQLLTVDHQPNSAVAVSVDGEIMAYDLSATPVAAYDHTGQDCLAELSELDGNLYSVNEPGYLIVTFAETASGTKGYRTNTATKYECELLREPESEWNQGGNDGDLDQISFEMLDADGNWQALPEMPSRVTNRQEVLIAPAADMTTEGPVTLRISWADSYETDAVVQLLPTAEEPTVAYWRPSAHEARIVGDSPQLWQSFESNGTLILKKGDVFDFSFALEDVAAGLVRDYVIVATGRYEPDQEAYAAALPNETSLRENFPNPFNPTTTISYSLSEAASVKLEVFNVVGQHVTTLVEQYQPAGFYEAEWNATTVASGVYLYRLTVGDFVETKKMILTK